MINKIKLLLQNKNKIGKKKVEKHDNKMITSVSLGLI